MKFHAGDRQIESGNLARLRVYLWKPDKGWGLAYEDGKSERVFVHCYKERRIVWRRDTAEADFLSLGVAARRAPEKGEEICCALDRNEQGLFATDWVFASDLTDVEQRAREFADQELKRFMQEELQRGDRELRAEEEKHQDNLLLAKIRALKKSSGVTIDLPSPRLSQHRSFSPQRRELLAQKPFKKGTAKAIPMDLWAKLAEERGDQNPARSRKKKRQPASFASHG